MNNHGGTKLHNACTNGSADDRMLRVILDRARAHAVDIDVNYQMAPRTTKWYLYGWMFQTVVRLGISGSDHATDFAHDQGSTALHLASKRGNLGQVIYLLEHGAQDSLWAKNAMGHTPCCQSASKAYGINLRGC